MMVKVMNRTPSEKHLYADCPFENNSTSQWQEHTIFLPHDDRQVSERRIGQQILHPCVAFVNVQLTHLSEFQFPINPYLCPVELDDVRKQESCNVTRVLDWYVMEQLIVQSEAKTIKCPKILKKP